MGVSNVHRMTETEWGEFERLQQRLPTLFSKVFDDYAAERTVVVVPGLSLDPEVLATVSGVRCYEERMLSMLMLLRMPSTHVVFVTSMPIDPAVIDYYLGLLPGIPGGHARQRLTLLSAHDASASSLTCKILDRPRLIERIRRSIGNPKTAHLSVFNSTPWEAKLTCLLGIPLYACDPRLQYWGSKSGSREAFARAGVAYPDGAEKLPNLAAAAAAIVRMRERDPGLRRVVLKLEEGFSGDGNARLDLRPLAGDANAEQIRAALTERIEPEANAISTSQYCTKYDRDGGIVEAWVEGEHKSSPSVQLRINPLGEIELISTHDQELGGRSGQVFLGSRFPADQRYRQQLHVTAMAVAEVLAQEGVIGRFSVDFLHCTQDGQERLQAIEVNVRKGGTTLPYQMLQFLTAGKYHSQRGEFLTPLGQPRAYVATDNLQKDAYRRLCPDDLIDVLVQNGLHFDNTRQIGVVFNLIGALSEFGKLGLVSIAEDAASAQTQYEAAVAVLDREAKL